LKTPVSFDGKVQDLSKNFEQVASGFSKLRQDMKTRVEELTSTLVQADKQWDMTAKAVEQRAEVGGAGAAEARGKDMAPAKALAAHLAGK
jgi:hypothetical protein